MTRFTTPHLTIRTARSIHEIEANEWDTLTAGQPFQSHRWYQFGERVMAGREPTYLLAYQDEMLTARACLWKIPDEPLPIRPGAGRALLKALLRRWPLLVCRSPLANTSGLALPNSPSRAETLRALAASAVEVRRQKHCSFLVFDFLGQQECIGWPANFSTLTVSDPGTMLQNRWQTLDAYLADRNKKDRQHYKRTLREAEKLGLSVEKRSRVSDVDAALELIHKVDQRYQNESTPWMRSLLQNIELANGTWLEIRQHGKLVGCGASFVDNEAQLTTALGLEKDIPYVYLLLTYASLEEAISNQVRLLRWGSGAYEVKRQLGFELEDNASIAVSSGSPLFQHLIRLFS